LCFEDCLEAAAFRGAEAAWPEWWRCHADVTQFVFSAGPLPGVRTLGCHESSRLRSTRGGPAMTQPSNPRPASFSPKPAVVPSPTRGIGCAVWFSPRHFGFHLRMRAGPGFALVSRGELNLILSGPGTSGARPMPDGHQQEPGGWNRIVLYVDSIDSTIATLKEAGVPFRNEIEAGAGGAEG